MTGSPRSRVLLAAVVITLLVIGSVLNFTAPKPFSVYPANFGPRIPEKDELAAWYCAEGTSTLDGRADETIYVANIGNETTRAVLTVFAGAEQTPKSHSFDVPRKSLRAVRVGDVLATPEPGVLVEVLGGQAVVSHGITGNGDAAVGPCAREPTSRLFFGGATTAKGASLWLALFNAFDDDAIVDVHFLTDKGPEAPEGLQGLIIARRTRVTVPVHDFARRDNLVSAVVSVRRGRVVGEQTLALDGTDGRKGLAMTLGIEAPARRWEIATGLITSGRLQTLSVANPGAKPALVRVSPRLYGDASVAPIDLLIPVGSVVPVDLSVLPPDIGFSLKVRANSAVIAETTVALVAPKPSNEWAIASSVGSDRGARRWVVSPARISATSSEIVYVLNAGKKPTQVRVRVVGRGTIKVPVDFVRKFKLGPGKRRVLDLANVVGATALVVSGDGELIVEREAQSIPGESLAAAVPGS